MTPRIREIVRVSAADAVQRELMRLVRSGTLKDGDKLPSEQELARQFGVSRPVVREALGSLRAMGLVTSHTGRGSFVASNSAGSSSHLLLGQYTAESLHEVRRHVEVPGACLAAQRHSDEHLRRLREVVEALEECTDPLEWVELDAAFHVRLAEATENPVQTRIVEALRDLHLKQSIALAGIPGRISQANVEHRAIFDAVAAHDADEAERAMAKHLRTVEEATAALSLPAGGPNKSPDERRET